MRNLRTIFAILLGSLIFLLLGYFLISLNNSGYSMGHKGNLDLSVTGSIGDFLGGVFGSILSGITLIVLIFDNKRRASYDEMKFRQEMLIMYYTLVKSSVDRITNGITFEHLKSYEFDLEIVQNSTPSQLFDYSKIDKRLRNQLSRASQLDEIIMIFEHINDNEILNNFDRDLLKKVVTHHLALRTLIGLGIEITKKLKNKEECERLIRTYLREKSDFEMEFDYPKFVRGIFERGHKLIQIFD